MTNRIVTYSLLAHINDSGTLSKTFEDIFIPLVKRGISKMCAEGQFQGDSINDIKRHIDAIYGLDIPLSILQKLLDKVARLINTSEEEFLKFFRDKSFVIKNYTFDEYEEEIERKNKELKVLEKVYKDFLMSEGLQDKMKVTSIYEFVEESRNSLGKYINSKYPVTHSGNTVEARFVNFIQSIPSIYAIFQAVYIGSIISAYLEYEPKDINRNVEFVLDTNFVISLLDLSTEQSTINCRRLLDLAKKLGYKFSVLDITLREINQLLSARVECFDDSFLSRLVDPEDIYNACQRRKLTKTDLDRIRYSVEHEVSGLGIDIVINTKKYENQARFTSEFERLQKIRNTEFAALHDATCIAYVTGKRGKIFYDFQHVNCWLVNNSSSRNSYPFTKGQQPVTIKAEDLLNMFWLTFPMVKKMVPAKEMAVTGLSRLVAVTLNNALPHSAIIKELDENIRKYARQNISDQDIVRISNSIAQDTVVDLSKLNQLAKTDAREFVKSLLNIANEQKQKEEEFTALLDKLMKELSKQVRSIEDQRELRHKTEKQLSEVILMNSELAKKARLAEKDKTDLCNIIIKEKRELYSKRKVKRWRTMSWFQFGLCIAVPLIVLLIIFDVEHWDWNSFSSVMDYCKANPFISVPVGIIYLFISGVVLMGLAHKYHNYPNIAKFKEEIKFPKDLEYLNSEEQ